METEIIAGIVQNVQPAQVTADVKLADAGASADDIRTSVKGMIFLGNKFRRKVTAKMVGVPKVQMMYILSTDARSNTIDHFKYYTESSIEMVLTGNMTIERLGGIDIYESSLLLEKHNDGIIYKKVEYDFTKISAMLIHNEAFCHEYQMVAVKDMRNPTSGNDGLIFKYR